MCMMLYIGSDIPLPLVPFAKKTPGFHTESLRESDGMIARHFSTAYILYAVSSQGCGCGFQHALIDTDTNWLNVVDEDSSDCGKNMQQLYTYVEGVIDKGGRVELYACWDGYFEDAPLSKEAVSYKELTGHEFYLKEKGFYTLIPIP